MITKKTIGDIEYLSANDVFLQWSKGKYVKKQKGQFLSNKGTKCLIEKLNEIHILHYFFKQINILRHN